MCSVSQVRGLKAWSIMPGSDRFSFVFFCYALLTIWKHFLDLYLLTLFTFTWAIVFSVYQDFIINIFVTPFLPKFIV